jgi:hypothetical protein
MLSGEDNGTALKRSKAHRRNLGVAKWLNRSSHLKLFETTADLWDNPFDGLTDRYQGRICRMASHVVPKLQALAEAFEQRFGMSLWRTPPTLEISELNRAVTDMDSFKARLFSMVAIFDGLNRRDFEKQTGIASKGSRDAWFTFLKDQFQNEHPRIQDDIETPLGRIAQLRSCLAHARGKDCKRAFKYFDIVEPIEDPTNAWEKVAYRFAEIIDVALGLVRSRPAPVLTARELTDAPLRALVKATYERFRSLIEDESVAPILREIAHHDTVLDTVLAARFNITVEELRSRLYFLLGPLIHVRPNDNASTHVSIPEPFREFLQDPSRWRLDEEDQ